MLALVALVSSTGVIPPRESSAPANTIAGLFDASDIAAATPPPFQHAICRPTADPAHATLLPPQTDDYIGLIAERVQRYHDQNRSFHEQLQHYDPTGDYLHYGRVLTYEENDRIRFDPDGIPTVNYNGVFHYNPVTIAQYALTLHGRVLTGDATSGEFLAVADFLVDMQETDGSFRYPFTYEYYLTGEDLRPGWVSGMAQGQAISAFARAYALTGEERYVDAAHAALAFMLAPVEDGGTLTTLADLHPSLDHYAFISEYPTNPEFYTLNGFIFSILGLYDWTQVAPADDPVRHVAEDFLACSLASLELMLPLFDAGGFSAYDLGFLMLDSTTPNLHINYHAIHIHQLYALHSITGIEKFLEYAELWASYVGESLH